MADLSQKGMDVRKYDRYAARWPTGY